MSASFSDDQSMTGNAACLTGNAACLAEFADWVAVQRNAAFASYRMRLNKSLALQSRQQLTQRAMLGAVEEVFDKALAYLANLDFDMAGIAVEQGRSALTPQVQAPFQAFLRSFFEDVVAFNQTSCALSNFPDEHHLPADYRQAMLRDIAAAWQEFSLAANDLLLSRMSVRGLHLAASASAGGAL
jgi:monoamine oxidase